MIFYFNFRSEYIDTSKPVKYTHGGSYEIGFMVNVPNTFPPSSYLSSLEYLFPRIQGLKEHLLVELPEYFI
jgi:hypothetical protein